MKTKISITKKVRQLSRTQQGISLTREDRELLEIKVDDLIEIKKLTKKETATS